MKLYRCAIQMTLNFVERIHDNRKKKAKKIGAISCRWPQSSAGLLSAAVTWQMTASHIQPLQPASQKTC